MSETVHQAGAYPVSCSMKRLGVFVLLPGWDASPLEGYRQHYICWSHLYTWNERRTVRVKCFAQEHNIHVMSLTSRAQSRPLGLEMSTLTTAPPTIIMKRKRISLFACILSVFKVEAFSFAKTTLSCLACLCFVQF